MDMKYFNRYFTSLFRSSIPTLEEKVAAINANKGPVSKSGL